MGSRRRCAAMASSSRVAAFSRRRSSSSAPRQVCWSTTWGFAVADVVDVSWVIPASFGVCFASIHPVYRPDRRPTFIAVSYRTYVRYDQHMGWFTGPSWGEIERVLNSKPRRAGMPLEPPVDGGDSPAWSRKRGAYLRPDDVRRGESTPYAAL